MRPLWVLMVIACGNGSSSVPPDVAVDAVDAAPLDAFAGPIRVVAYDQHGPQPHLPMVGAMVRFVAPDGSFQTVSTDAAGIATATAEANTTVLLFQRGEGNFPLVKAFVGANPGDEIAIGKYSREAFVDIGDVTFEVPEATGATQYKLNVSCSRRVGLTDRQFVMRATDCAVHQDATAIAWAEGPTGAVIGGASVLTGLNLATLAGTSVTMPAYAAQTSMTGSMVNVPATATDAAWSAYYYMTGDRMLLAAAGATTATATVPVFDTGERTVSTLTFRLPGFERTSYFEHHASKLSTVTLDAAAAIRPFTNVRYEHATGSVLWDEAASGQPPTIVTFRMTTFVNNTTKMMLHLHAPYDPSRSIEVPPLPAELAIGPTETVTVGVTRFHTLVGKSYSETLELVDTSAVVEHDPAFTGKLWVVR